ncbi:MAG: hypothetical protein AAF828_06740, partial [Bacteroidota bacterium]
ITYEVLNWCEYNTEDAAYRIPRDADNDNNLTEDTYLHVIPRVTNTLSDDLAFLDRDNNRNNSTTIANLDTGDGGILAGSDAAGYGQDGSRGAYTYQQYVKVYDDTAPELVVDAGGEFGDEDGDCIDDATLTFSVTDLCSPASVNAIAILDAFIDAGADGVYTLADFVGDGGNVTGAISNDGMGNFTVSLTDLPLGDHAIRVTATDGCGNTAVDLITFSIVDRTAPTPIFINNLPATLMPLGSPGDGAPDDATGGGMAAIWAIDFIASPSTDCAGEVKFAIYTAAFAAAQDADWAPSVDATGIDMTCDDLGMLPVRIYAIDPNGQFDYCETSVFVQAFADGVCSETTTASAAGAVMTAANEMMDNVEVNISGNMVASEYTTAGLYQFTDLTLGEDYSIEPNYNPAINLANVSTGDLILISRHILGLDELAGEYQFLAGDVNQDGVINVLDIIAIRRVILGLDDQFSATNSWRFYLAGDENYAEVFTENNLAGNLTGIDFIAVEMGNVSDAIPGYSSRAESRGVEAITIEDVFLIAGEEVTVELAGDLLGFQGTLALTTGVEVMAVTASDNSTTAFNLEEVANGLIGFSSMTGTGFTLSLRAATDIKLRDVLSLSDRIVLREAYTNDGAADLQLDFVTPTELRAELFQNIPNPFRDRTQINFLLPRAGTATLLVQNQKGQLLASLKIDGQAGYNQVSLDRRELKGASGVLTYTLVFDDFTATRKMILLR